MKNISFIKITLAFIGMSIILSCKSNLNKQFDIENEQIKTEFKTETEKFVKQNSQKLSEKEILKSLDSITEEYIIHKNKKLAVKYIESESGIKRLNFLKKYFSKEEMNVLLRKVPEKLKADTNYVAMEKYISSK